MDAIHAQRTLYLRSLTSDPSIWGDLNPSVTVISQNDGRIDVISTFDPILPSLPPHPWNAEHDTPADPLQARFVRICRYAATPDVVLDALGLPASPIPINSKRSEARIQKLLLSVWESVAPPKEPSRQPFISDHERLILVRWKDLEEGPRRGPLADLARVAPGSRALMRPKDRLPRNAKIRSLLTYLVQVRTKSHQPLYQDGGQIAPGFIKWCRLATLSPSTLPLLPDREYREFNLPLAPPRWRDLEQIAIRLARLGDTLDPNGLAKIRTETAWQTFYCITKTDHYQRLVPAFLRDPERSAAALREKASTIAMHHRLSATPQVRPFLQIFEFLGDLDHTLAEHPDAIGNRTSFASILEACLQRDADDAMEISEEDLNALIKEAERNPTTFPDPPFYSAQAERIRLEACTLDLELLQESKAMRHCVGTFRMKPAQEGECFIYSVFDRDRHIGTLEIQPPDWHIAELKGRRNTALSAETEDAVRAALESALAKVRSA